MRMLSVYWHNIRPDSTCKPHEDGLDPPVGMVKDHVISLHEMVAPCPLG
jgi:hypothetical protein